MDKIHYYRGTMTDGRRMSTDILSLSNNGLNEEYIRDPQGRPWYETPFKGIRFVDPKKLITINPSTRYGIDIFDFAMLIRDALHRYWLSVLKPDEKYLFFHSGGYDSRVLSLSLMELRESRDDLTRNIHFRCHQPEEPMFLEIMRRQGWDKSQYSVYEGPQEDYYDIGRMDRPLNGWQHFNQQMNFWSDIAPDEKQWTLITGVGGELFKFIAKNRPIKHKRVDNEALNWLIDAYPFEGQWEGYWRRIFKELLLPYWSFEYLMVACSVDPRICIEVKDTDSVRAVITVSYMDTHNVDCRNIEYGRHDYSWNISEKRKQEMRDAFYTSDLYKDMELGTYDFFNNIYNAQLWGFMTTYDASKKTKK